ncbi:DUF803-domain-containing protein [Auriscalpium vulgare]|uniref:DUF803-domain-containing protein n=1 Tax=Auriscalpium vulgare TaxID=40419 RepID=A0ACB8SB76_9AGAM|nr:DUF803-domain-containing protein [Auriscalpium vulgare]
MPTSPGIEEIEFPHFSTGTVIGIAVAITGNVLISFALNLQKLAHARLDEDRHAAGQGQGAELDEREEARVHEDVVREANPWSGGLPEATEADPLLFVPPGTHAHVAPVMQTYGAVVPDGAADDGSARRTWGTLIKWERRSNLPPNGKQGASTPIDDIDDDEGQEYDYLKSKVWWSGFVLMNVGEIGNFLSYAFAPASVVAPLGTFALIANCFFAPLLLHERFRKRDLLGVVIAIVGAVTVVLSSNTSDTRLTPEGIVKAISQRIFIVYSIAYLVGVIFLAGLSEGRVGRRSVLVDLGLCALFGGFTVLSTKGFSTLLTTRGLEMFKEWITYPILAVLVGTGIGQIRYLNRALMRFDSKVVIPTQFVLFNLSVIVGSAILYGDFRRAKFHQLVTFVYGCVATFAGVWVIAYSPPYPSEQDNVAEGEDGAQEDTVGVLVSGLPGEALRRNSAASGMPFLRPRQSTVSLVGLSPAQRLLLVHTPPRPEHQLQGFGGRDVELGGRERLGSIGRRPRAISWLEEGSPRPFRIRSREGSRSRERGSVER